MAQLPYSVSFSFGSFNWACNQVSLPLCPLIGSEVGVQAECYARNIELGSGNIFFQPGTFVIEIVALVMTAIMIFHIKSKYTAVGRKEIVMFFYMYMLCTLLNLLLVTNIIRIDLSVYKYFVGIHIGLVVATFWCLLLNGFVGFQWAEDGTPLSLWSIRISTLVVFGVVTFVALGTFLGIGSLSYSSTAALFVLYFIFCLVFLLVYVVLQIILVLNTLEDRWPLGDILLGVLFFVGGVICLFVVSDQICFGTKRYIDGLFFGSVCMLLSVMMVYKYWDSITKEDLEFSVGGNGNNWTINDPLLNDEAMMELEKESNFIYAQQQQNLYQQPAQRY